MKAKGLFKGVLKNGTELIVEKDTYVCNKNICLQAYCLTDDDGLFYLEPYATLTVNLDQLTTNEIAIDVNNFPEGLSFLLENNFIDKPHRYEVSGFCLYPVARINASFSMEAIDIEMDESKAMID